MLGLASLVNQVKPVKRNKYQEELKEVVALLEKISNELRLNDSKPKFFGYEIKSSWNSFGTISFVVLPIAVILLSIHLTAAIVT